jgi:hypothetical protein
MAGNPPTRVPQNVSTPIVRNGEIVAPKKVVVLILKCEDPLRKHRARINLFVSIFEIRVKKSQQRT